MKDGDIWFLYGFLLFVNLVGFLIFFFVLMFITDGDINVWWLMCLMLFMLYFDGRVELSRKDKKIEALKGE